MPTQERFNKGVKRLLVLPVVDIVLNASLGIKQKAIQFHQKLFFSKFDAVKFHMRLIHMKWTTLIGRI